MKRYDEDKSDADHHFSIIGCQVAIHGSHNDRSRQCSMKKKRTGYCHTISQTMPQTSAINGTSLRPVKIACKTTNSDFFSAQQGL